MKDFYSFHADENDFNNYYEVMKKAYQKVFKRCGLTAIETKAGGGTFSQFSHEYQVASEAGEDTILYCPTFAKATAGKAGCHFSENQEITENKEGDKCPICSEKLLLVKAIEVGNIFPLKTKFSEAFGLTYKDKNGQNQLVVMGCYGIGISRLMGTIVEVHHDERGIRWPEGVAPFQVHLVHVEDPGTEPTVQKVYKELTNAGVEVLWDDRETVSAGEKFADADLIGIPVRLVVSAKTKDKVEMKKRDSEKTELLSMDEVLKKLS